jgi:hypothetical protein
VRGERLELHAQSYGSDEYPLRELRTTFDISDLNQAIGVCSPKQSAQLQADLSDAPRLQIPASLRSGCEAPSR